MKHAAVTLTAVAVALICGLANGDEPSAASRHLKCYRGFIGTWRYEGPLLEDIPDVAEKGSKLLFQFSWKWILDKNVVEEDWLIQFEGSKLAGKSLVGWNAAENEIAYGGMHASGGMMLGTVTVDEASHSMTLTAKGINGDGEAMEVTNVVTRKDENTITWKSLHRKGGVVEGPSPEYTFK